MSFWTRFPAFRVFFPFSFGIALSESANINAKLWLVLFIVSFLVLILTVYLKPLYSLYVLRWVTGVPVYLGFFVAGLLLHHLHKEEFYQARFPESDHINGYVVKILEDPITTRSGFKCKTEVVHYQLSSKWKPCRGKSLIYFKDINNPHQVKFGDYVLINCNIRQTESPKNPVTFNYRTYLKRQGIYHQGFVDPGSYVVLQNNSTGGLQYLANHLRKMLLQRLSENLNSESQKGVAGALLLGYDGWLDEDQENDFARVGVLHVLCVSGMHVGLIYMISMWLLGWMNKIRFLKPIRLVFLLLIIWLYAMVTGMAPSVMRAATMLTLVALATVFGRTGNVYNLLCVTGLFLLCLDPGLLFSAGFQLSFLAVCGIVFFHPLIYSIFRPSSLALKRMWELMSISVAAQLTTFPLSIYLFHQFPNYFLLGNLLILPLIGLIMYSGLAVLILGAIPFIGALSGKITSLLINVLNHIVAFISEIPGAITENIYLAYHEVVLLYIIIAMIPLWIHFKQRFLLVFILLMTCAFISCRTIVIIRALHQFELVVYHHKSTDLILLYKGRKALLISDTVIDAQLLKYTAADDMRNKLINDTICINKKFDQFIWLADFNTLLVSNWERGMELPDKLHLYPVQNLILCRGVKGETNSLITHLKPERIIIGSGVNNFQSGAIFLSAGKYGIPVHDISKHGYFTEKH